MTKLGYDPERELVVATVEYDATNVPARDLYGGLGFLNRYRPSASGRRAGAQS